MKKNKLHDAIEKVLFSDLGIFQILTSISKNCGTTSCENCIFYKSEHIIEMESATCLFEQRVYNWQDIIPILQKKYIENKKEKK